MPGVVVELTDVGRYGDERLLHFGSVFHLGKECPAFKIGDLRAFFHAKFQRVACATKSLLDYSCRAARLGHQIRPPCWTRLLACVLFRPTDAGAEDSRTSVC